MGHSINAGLDMLKIRKSLPKELEREFVTFKDIACIDRIQASAWIGFALTICLFGLDAYRKSSGELYTNPYYLPLFYFHFVGLLFLIPAIHITLHKKKIIQTRLRRGIVIWGMVVLTIVFMLGQSVLVYLDRGANVMFLGYIFVCSWMFAMSNTERILFVVGSILVMSVAIFHWEERLSTSWHLVSFLEITFLSATAFLFDAFDYNLNLSNFLSRREIEREQERISKLEEFKSRFFTNLTHELRTPLTIISGMATEISEDPKRWATEGSEVISRNAGNLLNLINQILALSKIESGSMPIHMVQGDIVSYLGYVVDAFRGHALAKRIKLHFLAEESEVIMDYDQEKYMTILSNLISNAIKFTPEDGNVYVNLVFRNMDKDSVFELTVRDTGIGIPQDELEHIFERFYQAQNELTGSGIGTGIGLSLVYELVKMLEGEIHVRSAKDKGTTFTISFPLRRQTSNPGAPVMKEDIRSNINFLMPSLPHDNIVNTEEVIDDKPDLLIIEDNPDVLKYLQVCLADYYRIATCTDGQQGIDKAIEMVPDLILSDVLMPVRDGLAVCRELKHHPVTNHIPIVLLSAKVDPESRLAGLESGADVYLVKPFDKKELRMLLHNLLERRHALHTRYSYTVTVPPTSEIDQREPEDPFIGKARAVVLEHLDETEFSVMHLYRAVFLSRTQLHKKLKALTGMSATHFIRHIRLSKAKELLKDPDLNITEIAYQVGFSDPNYFTRCFGEEFGESPSETRNRK
ncbi:MAG TPA: ATP-binding protein [Saprospiraceae bacterium]|nr:ATP-binding protein [Saprospiraceae bacterium]